MSSSSWVNVIPPNVGGGSVSGIVAVGTGLLAFGDFTSIGNRAAAGLAYYEGAGWCAPEGVGLFTYTQKQFHTLFNNTPTATSSAFAATVDGNDVYLLGLFNQVGLIRDGVGGMVKLTWSAGGIFTIGQVGTNGYNQMVTGIACLDCPRTTQPTAGGVNKLMSYTVNTDRYFVFQDSNPGNLYQWLVGSPRWNVITDQNTARNITSQVRDFDINNGVIYVVGEFYNLLDPVATNQYMHIASSSNQGLTWVQATSGLTVANFGNLPQVVNSDGTSFPALTGSGFTAIAVESATSIYVAGGYRITSRNISAENLAGQLQTVVVHITGNTFSVSQRFAGSSFGPAPNFAGPTIYKLLWANNALYAFGDFLSYRQVVPFNERFGTRFTDVYKGAARMQNNEWSPAFGGFLTSSYSGDSSPSSVMTAFNSQMMFFYGTFSSTYELLSGGLFAYGGNKEFRLNNRWNNILQNQRFVSASPYNNGIGQDGNIYALHITKRNDLLIVGGAFDWIGNQRVGAIAAYDINGASIQQIGGGIYYTNEDPNYFGDSTYYNRVGGKVYDIEEWDDRLIIAGSFNRNNSGNCVSNIAWNKFRVTGAGWEAIDGGCDGKINDILLEGNILYITGTFLYCGLYPERYTGGLYRGSIPTSRIARIDLNDKNRSWRNLGVGINGEGTALAWRNGELFVGGSFTSAGGRISTAGIARWRKDHWRDVVAKCRGDCSRDVNVLPYIGTASSPASNSRKPGACSKLSNYDGRIYCIDSSASRLAYFTSDTWYRAADFTVTTATISQNSLIIRNDTNHRYILVPSTSATGSNGANFVAYDKNVIQFAPSHGGFSNTPTAMAEGNALVIPKLLIFVVVIIISFFF